MFPGPEAKYTLRRTGEPCTKEYRVYITADDDIVFPRHEMPLFPSKNEPQVVNMAMEIPRWRNVKMEIAKAEFLIPIRQDIHNGKLRYVPNIFPHKGYLWNYGFFAADPNMPGYLATIQERLRLYKVPEGKEEDEVAMNGQLKGKECHGSWKKTPIEPALKTKISLADIGIEDNKPHQTA